jgi:hypothetical protein
MMDTARGYEEQEHATYEFDQAVEALGDDADLEDTVQPVFWFEHRLPSSQAISSVRV